MSRDIFAQSRVSFRGGAIANNAPLPIECLGTAGRDGRIRFLRLGLRHATEAALRTGVQRRPMRDTLRLRAHAEHSGHPEP